MRLKEFNQPAAGCQRGGNSAMWSIGQRAIRQWALRQHAEREPGIIMPAVPKASKEVWGRALVVIGESKADCYDVCQFRDQG